MQGKLFQRCRASFVLLSLGGNVNTRRMSKPDMGSIFHIKNQWNILVIGNYYVNYQNYQNLMLLTSSDTKRTLMHLFLFKNSAHKRTGYNVYAEYTRPQLTFLALHPWLIPFLHCAKYTSNSVLLLQEIKRFHLWPVLEKGWIYSKERQIINKLLTFVMFYQM